MGKAYIRSHTTLLTGHLTPIKRHSFRAAAKVSNVSLHPTTAGLALVTSTSPVVAIYDVAASTPNITLKTTGDVALWDAAWAADGRLVGGVCKKGKAYIWDAHAGADAVQTKDVAMQPLKPARLAFVGGDLFVTSFSRTRARQYSLLSASAGLSATFTATVDNSQGPLVPIVDEEREIVFCIGRGDMRLRQIELSGSHGIPGSPSHSPLAGYQWQHCAVSLVDTAGHGSSGRYGSLADPGQGRRSYLAACYQGASPSTHRLPCRPLPGRCGKCTEQTAGNSATTGCGPMHPCRSALTQDVARRGRRVLRKASRSLRALQHLRLPVCPDSGACGRSSCCRCHLSSHCDTAHRPKPQSQLQLLNPSLPSALLPLHVLEPQALLPPQQHHLPPSPRR